MNKNAVRKGRVFLLNGLQISCVALRRGSIRAVRFDGFGLRKPRSAHQRHSRVDYGGDLVIPVKLKGDDLGV